MGEGANAPLPGCDGIKDSANILTIFLTDIVFRF
jgi:hypothetical protein